MVVENWSHQAERPASHPMPASGLKLCPNLVIGQSARDHLAQSRNTILPVRQLGLHPPASLLTTAEALTQVLTERRWLGYGHDPHLARVAHLLQTPLWTNLRHAVSVLQNSG